MRHLIFSSLKRRKLSSLFFISALILILTVTPLAVISLENAQNQIKSDVTHYARGSYDLLVRPLSATHPMEDELGIVPENYIGFGEGGISIAQWEHIQSMANIEIAAPVASLGYFTGIKTNVAIFPPTESMRYLLQYYTTDGVNQHHIGPEYACFQLVSPFKKEEFQSLYSHDESVDNCKDGVSMFSLPPTYHLLVGVDPKQEEALTGVSFDSINPERPKSGWGSVMRSDYYPDATTIPVLETQDENSSLEATLKVDRLSIYAEQTLKYRTQIGLPNDLSAYVHGRDVQNIYFTNKSDTPEYEQLVEELRSLPAKEQTVYELPLGNRLNPFNQSDNTLFITELGDIDLLADHHELFMDGYNMDIHLSTMNVHYTAGLLQYENNDGQLVIKKVDEVSGIPIYRELVRHGEPLADLRSRGENDQVEYLLDPVDQVEIGSADQSQLSSSPLGIYQFAPVYFIDEQTNERVEMKPTITPGSFVSVPAKGLTNIESAEIIKGDEPIDAIRVKVSGISSYTKEAAKKIDEVAEEIESMGLQVTIVAGASPQKLIVDVEGVGLVEESWTTLGAAGSIITEWNATTIILSVLFSITAIIYIWNRMIFWQTSEQQSIRLLFQLGWDVRHMRQYAVMDSLLPLFIAFILSYVPVFVLQIGTDASNLIYLWHMIGMVFATIMFIVIILTKMSKMNKGIRTQTRRRFEQMYHLQSFVLKNILHFSTYVRSPFIQLFVVSLLSSFVYLSLTETVEQTNMTLLGEYINVQTSKWHVILMVAAYVLAVFTLVESLLSLLKARENEIGLFRSIGWKNTHIIRLYMKEVAIWSGTGIVMGTIVSGICFIALYSLKSTVILLLLGSFVGFYFTVLVTAYVVIRLKLTKDIHHLLYNRRSGSNKMKSINM